MLSQMLNTEVDNVNGQWKTNESVSVQGKPRQTIMKDNIKSV